MKYKRRKTKVSRYIAQSDKSSAGSRKFFSLKWRSAVSVLLVVLAFSLTRTGVVRRSLVQELTRESSGVFVRLENAAKDLPFINSAAAVFMSVLDNFRNNEKVKTNAYAPEETPEVSVSGQKNEEIKSSAEIVFSPIIPCVGRISSDFGQRVHPLKSEVSFHNGIDIATNHGEEVRACFDGVVDVSQYNQYSGNHIIIKHALDYSSSYAHLSQSFVKAGDEVKKGEVIALTGSTGEATGPHLHFEIRHLGTPVNPHDLIKG